MVSEITLLQLCGEPSNMLADSKSASEAVKRADAAIYIASLAADLAVIARTHGLDTLGYIFEMARLEAENASADGK